MGLDVIVDDGLGIFSFQSWKRGLLLRIIVTHFMISACRNKIFLNINNCMIFKLLVYFILCKESNTLTTTLCTFRLLPLENLVDRFFEQYEFLSIFSFKYNLF